MNPVNFIVMGGQFVAKAHGGGTWFSIFHIGFLLKDQWQTWTSTSADHRSGEALQTPENNGQGQDLSKQSVDGGQELVVE